MASKFLHKCQNLYFFINFFRTERTKAGNFLNGSSLRNDESRFLENSQLSSTSSITSLIKYVPTTK